MYGSGGTKRYKKMFETKNGVSGISIKRSGLVIVLIISIIRIATHIL